MAQALLIYTPWQVSRDLVAKVYSSSFADRWLLEQVAAGRIRWRARATHPPDLSSGGFWRNPATVTVDQDGSATAMMVTNVDGVVGLESVRLFGIELARADLEALLPKISPAPSKTKANTKDLIRAEAARLLADSEAPGDLKTLAYRLADWWNARSGVKPLKQTTVENYIRDLRHPARL